MGTRSQKTRKNIALKFAIFERGLFQREVAQRAGIPEVRLSLLVRGMEPTDAEKRALARVLRRKAADLFPVNTDQAVAS